MGPPTPQDNILVVLVVGPALNWEYNYLARRSQYAWCATPTFLLAPSGESLPTMTLIRIVDHTPVVKPGQKE